MIDTIINKLCSIQGRLFELATSKEYDSEQFITIYMKSDVAKHFNSEYDSLQWMGEEYILDLLEEKNQFKKGFVYDKDVMFWIGYIYCYWHFYSFDSCNDIVSTASPKTMLKNYYAMHMIDYDLAIENLMQLKLEERIRRQDKEIFKYVAKSIIDSLEISINEKEYRKILIEIVIEEKDRQLKEKIKYNNHIKLSENIKTIRFSYIQFIINLIDESLWPIAKKVEYKLIIDKIENKIVNYGFSEENYAFLEGIYQELYKKTTYENL